MGFSVMCTVLRFRRQEGEMGSTPCGTPQIMAVTDQMVVALLLFMDSYCGMETYDLSDELHVQLLERNTR